MHGDAFGDDHDSERDRRPRWLRVTAALAKAGGTKIDRRHPHPVADMASATVANTGTVTPAPASTSEPALRGFTPPTTWRAGGHHPPGVLGALGAGDALDDDLAVFVDEDCHDSDCLAPELGRAGQRRHPSCRLAFQTGDAGAVQNGGDLRRRCCHRGVRRWASSGRPRTLAELSMPTAWTMPLATASQAVMPPKMLTKTDLTFGSPRMIPSPSAMTCAEAPPPMSRKFAGLLAAVLLACVSHDIERAHDQTCAVADDADTALELDVVEVLRSWRAPRAGRWPSRRRS